MVADNIVIRVCGRSILYQVRKIDGRDLLDVEPRATMTTARC